MRVSEVHSKISSQSFTATKKENTHTDILTMFHEKTKNSADLTDTILVPRTIFKGYLGIMAGTTLMTIASFLNRFSKISKAISITGLLTSLYGTFAFVRPYIIKDAKGVESGQKN